MGIRQCSDVQSKILVRVQVVNKAYYHYYSVKLFMPLVARKKVNVLTCVGIFSPLCNHHGTKP